MQQSVLEQAIEKLVMGGEQAGFSIQDMIRILDAGVEVKTLLDLIELSLRWQEEDRWDHCTGGEGRAVRIQ
jgi:hypothetical protein